MWDLLTSKWYKGKERIGGDEGCDSLFAACTHVDFFLT